MWKALNLPDHFDPETGEEKGFHPSEIERLVDYLDPLDEYEDEDPTDELDPEEYAHWVEDQIAEDSLQEEDRW